jgi:hypothetical protein
LEVFDNLATKLNQSLWSSGSHAVAIDDPDTPLSEIAGGKVVVMPEDRGLELIVDDTLMGGGELELEVTVTLGV